ncbi:hypothetical protein B0I37DRAFT_354650 [Chaetomium sp. MPI-CAGE-AT-0009]|nr:hypothetical protein B0I37DRAFT_354650 [Chaetomium sp. MPI-CAGE-AT-0009]
MVSPDAFPLFESWGLEEMHLGNSVLTGNRGAQLAKQEGDQGQALVEHFPQRVPLLLLLGKTQKLTISGTEGEHGNPLQGPRERSGIQTGLEPRDGSVGITGPSDVCRKTVEGSAHAGLAFNRPGGRRPKNEVKRRGTRATSAVGYTSPGGRAAQAHTRYGPRHTVIDGVEGTVPVHRVASSRERCGGGERLRLPGRASRIGLFLKIKIKIPVESHEWLPRCDSEGCSPKEERGRG